MKVIQHNITAKQSKILPLYMLFLAVDLENVMCVGVRGQHGLPNLHIGHPKSNTA